MPYRPRQFSPDAEAREWDYALAQPAVQRALTDPQVGPALAQLAQQGEMRLADGGEVGVPDPMTEEKYQQIQDEMRSEWEPMRFQEGGSTVDPGQLSRLSSRVLEQMYLNANNDSDRQKILVALESKPENAGAAGGVTIPGVAGGQPLTGLSKLTGPETPANRNASMILAGLSGLGVQGNISPMGRIGGALLAAAMAGLGNHYIRKYAQQKTGTTDTSSSQPTPTQQTTSNAGTVTAPSTTGPLPTAAQIAAKPMPGQTTTPVTTTSAQPAADTGGTDAEKQQALDQAFQAFERGEAVDLRHPSAPQAGAAFPATPPSDQRGMTFTIPGIGISDSEGRHWQNLPWPVGIPGAPGPPAPSGLGAAANSSLLGMAPTPEARTPADYRPAAEPSPYSAQGANAADPGTPLGPPGLPPTKEHPHGVPDPLWQKEHPEDYPLSDYARGGEVHGDAAQDRRQMLGILKEKGLLKKARGGKFAEGAAEDLPAPVPKKGKAVLLRKPMGAPIPVIHTTIVIAKPIEKEKPKKKKARGGTIVIPPSHLDTSARKPRAVPPKKGPMNGDQYAPYKKGGHVQAPRGSGAAIRGKRFTGIY